MFSSIHVIRIAGLLYRLNNTIFHCERRIKTLTTVVGVSFVLTSSLVHGYPTVGDLIAVQNLLAICRSRGREGNAHLCIFISVPIFTAVCIRQSNTSALKTFKILAVDRA
jgi:hypothetical protein